MLLILAHCDMNIAHDNLFNNLPDSAPAEIFQILQSGSNFKLERIISTGQATPAGEWFDQAQHEWVILLSGSAGLLFEGASEAHVLRPGDFFNIPAHQRHRVAWTDAQQPTVWLALHYSL